MSEIPSGFRRLPGFIDDVYEVESSIGKTVSAEVFKAFDRNAHRGILLWRTLTPVAPQQLDKFKARLTLVQRTPHVVPISIFGVDAGSIGFAILSSPDRRPINAPVVDAVEVERRLLSILAILEHLHENHVICGDICRDSFILERDGTVCLFGVMGALEIRSADKESSSPAIRSYLSPRSEEVFTPSAQDDVFAVLVLAQDLYSSISISGAGAHSKGVAIPAWIQQVLHGSREALSAGVPVTIRQIRADLERAKIEESDRAEAPEVIDTSYSDSTIAREFAEQNKSRAAKGPTNKALKLAASQDRKLLLSIGVGIAAVAAIIFGVLSRFDSGPSQKVEARRLVTDEEMRQVVAWRDSKEKSAHENLVKALRGAQNVEYRAEVVKALGARSRRYGFLRATDLLAQQFRLSSARNTFGNDGDSAALVDALDPSLDRETRNGELLRLSEHSPQTAAVMAVAFGLDSGELGNVRDLLARFVGEDASIAEVAERSALALML